MRSLRKIVKIKDGVDVQLLFTPHLFSFKGFKGASFDVVEGNAASPLEVNADIIYCAALNAWVLDGRGEPEEFPYTRGDFHEWMPAEPREFGRAINFATEALTGKPIGKQQEEAQPEPESKKKPLSWIGRLLRRSS